VSRYPSLTRSLDLINGCQMCWNYFGSGHGKGEVDDAGALLKWEICTEQLKSSGQKLQNVADIVRFLKDRSMRAHARPRGVRSETLKFFWLIPQSGPRSVRRTEALQVDRVPISMSQYQCRSVSARDPTLIQFRPLSCFFFACLRYGMHNTSHQIDHVEEFKVYRLSPKAPTQARRLYDLDKEIEAGMGGEWMTDGLGVGDNVAVWASLEEEPFWLMLVVKDVHVVEEAFIDPDGNNYVPSDVVFSGLWYERLKEGNCTYLLRNDREPSIVYSHLVLTSKFSLPPIMHSIKSRLSGFELQVEVKEIIEEAYTAAVSLD
jgi:hypothetical protein